MVKISRRDGNYDLWETKILNKGDDTNSKRFIYKK